MEPLILDGDLSEVELSSLQTSLDVCKRAFKATAEQMQPADNSSWAVLGVCDGNGGRLVCADREHSQDPFCHSFGVPTEFDLADVGKAIERYRAPHTCAIHCNSLEDRSSLVQQRTALELAATMLGKNVTNLGPDELQQLGNQIWQKLEWDPECTQKCFLQGCTAGSFTGTKSSCACTAARFDCESHNRNVLLEKINVFQKDQDNHIKKVGLFAFNTKPEKLFHKKFVRQGEFNVCSFECWVQSLLDNTTNTN
ncbi:hypothetical protein GNI_147700 [Gregarina niphandrodes]|uniref:Uncharacterized protein n=1 Tax=Gregarina niphandrodes TaxID=110365 RepID=A0A023AZS5_GRENI|nr:hypothetical protein GNI_147700 [Gregarina niphandrodes]EZG44405.1 hypothetical protein GNI_147700 [Gregarina niphandrodes]|eukprot:XP_011134183.1 hypothetical protein GNI_147700 [Gregarina niphandrodes]